METNSSALMRIFRENKTGIEYLVTGFQSKSSSTWTDHDEIPNVSITNQHYWVTMVGLVDVKNHNNCKCVTSKELNENFSLLG